MAGDGVERVRLAVEFDARTFAIAARRDLGDGGAMMRRDFVLRPQRDVAAAGPIEHFADIGEGDADELEQHAVALDLGTARLARAAEADRLGDSGMPLQSPSHAGGAAGRIAGADRRLAADAGDQVLLDEFLLPRTERPLALVKDHGTPCSLRACAWPVRAALIGRGRAAGRPGGSAPPASGGHW